MASAEQATVVVVGTANLDLSLKAPHLPQSGETVLGDFAQSGGGKAANQAVAAARLGADVHLVTRFGDDANGAELRSLLTVDGINLDSARVVPGGQTGVALIMVDANGHTMIGVAEGVNRYMAALDLEDCVPLRSAATTVVIELGVPVAVLERLAELRRDHGFKLIVNPAPYTDPLPDWLWPLIDVVTPNEIEASMMTGVTVTDEPSALEAAHVLRARGVDRVIITLGEHGVAYSAASGDGIIPAFRVTAVDTTAASDAFNGALAVALTRESSLSDALRYANAVAALSVTRQGAQSSLPTRDDVDQFLTNERTDSHNA